MKFVLLQIERCVHKILSSGIPVANNETTIRSSLENLLFTNLYTRLLAKTIRVSAPIGSNIDTPYDKRNCTKNEETNSVFVKDDMH
jgi:hypothetical protein